MAAKAPAPGKANKEGFELFLERVKQGKDAMWNKVGGWGAGGVQQGWQGV